MWSSQVEAMVRAKMECMEYIILCLEDTNDWSNATTRRLVMQVCAESSNNTPTQSLAHSICQFIRGAALHCTACPLCLHHTA